MIAAAMLRSGLVMGLSTLVIVAGTPAARAAGVVTVCDEAHLDTALIGGGLITFACGGPATITVTGTKTIAADTTIDGDGLITISGGHAVGVFFVASGVPFTIQDLTIADANADGGGGQGFAGGGGIFNQGTLTVTNSTFSGNSAPVGGGGIYNRDGTATITNSTFFGNDSPFGGGGIFNDAPFGVKAMLTVTNSTFVGNSGFAGGGIYNDGAVTIINSTFSGNGAQFGGGVFFNNLNMVTVTNTIVANSSSGGNCGGTIIDGGHNLDDGTTCGFSAANGSLSNTNPGLAPAGLANNGGPTQTIALQAGSPAINAGDQAVCAAPPVNNLDQRGSMRPGAGSTQCTIGAFEYNGGDPPRFDMRVGAPVVSSWGLLAAISILSAVAWLNLSRRRLEPH